MTMRRYIHSVQCAAIFSLPLLLLSACAEQQEVATAGMEDTPGAVGITVATAASASGNINMGTRSAGGAGRASGAGSAGVTRAATDLNGVFTDGEQFWAYMPDASGPTGQAYTVVDGSAGTTRPVVRPLVSDGNAATYPIYGYWPYAPAQWTTVPASPTAWTNATENLLSWSVAQNQQQDDDYRRSDLLYAEGTVSTAGTAANDLGTVGGTATSAAKLTFQHQMAKLILRPYATGASTKMTRLAVSSGYRTVALAGRAPLTFGEPSDELTSANVLTVYDAAGGDGVELPVEASAQDYCVLLPPQMLQQGTLVRLVTASGIRMNYRLTAATRIESGHAYRMTLPVRTLSMDVDIADWTEVTWNYGSSEEIAPGSNRQFTVGGERFNMVYIKEGKNTLTVNSGSSDNNRPAITFNEELKPYYMGETEVTQGLWKAVMGGLPTIRVTANSSGTLTTETLVQQAVGDDIPIARLPYNQIDAFIVKLNRLAASQLPAGYRFALPSASQWVYAANEANGSAWQHTYVGSDVLDDVAWHSGTSNASGGTAQGVPHPVAQLKPNALGLYDMTGNMAEWTSTANPKATANRICCGGTWHCNESDVTFRSAQSVYGGGVYQTVANYDWGFRLALVPETEYNTVAAFNASTDTEPVLRLPSSTTGSFTISRKDGVVDLNGASTGSTILPTNTTAGCVLVLKNGSCVGIDPEGGTPSAVKYAGSLVLDEMELSSILYTDGKAVTILSGTYNGNIPPTR